MKNENIERLEGYTSRELMSAAVKKPFKKKSVRLAVSAAAVVVSFVVTYILSKDYGHMLWWADCLVNLPMFILFLAGVGGFAANIGEFSPKRFVIASTICAIAAWVAAAALRVVGLAYLPLEAGLFFKGFGLELLRRLPLIAVSLAVVILTVKICEYKKRNA